MASETGALLARLHADTGLSWQALADTIGASSGDYVRKVASGAKPGNNLAGVVGELMSTGSVQRAVPRRRAASGKIARVRAAGATGAPSRRPSETAVRAPSEGRRVFTGSKGRLAWARSTGGPTNGAAFRDAIASAGRGRKRVSFRAKMRDANGTERWVTIGGKGGYSPADVRKGLARDGGVGDWLAGQVSKRNYAAAGGTIVDVEVVAE